MARAALKQVEQADEAPVSGGVEEIVINSQDSGDLDAMFSELENELENAGVNTSAVIPHDENTEADHIAAGRHITTEELKAKALEELEEQSQPLPDESRKPEAQKKKAPATKRISTLGLTVSQSLAQGLGAKLDELLTLDAADLSLSDEDAHNKRHAFMAELDDKLPKKVGEKVVNLFASIAKGATLSTYTRIAIDLLTKDGELTSKTLKDRYCVRYAENTASSQTTQMMKLLPLLGIARKEAGKIVLNENSLLAPMLTTAAPEAEPAAE